MPPDAPTPSAIRRAICREALGLSKRADAAGLAVSAGLLRLAALHAIPDFEYLDEANRPPSGAIGFDPMPDEPEALIAWAMLNLLKN